VQGLTYIPLEDADQCCGFGGTFAVKNADVSTAMVADKARCILNTKAEVCAALDNSCLMQIGGMLSRMNAGVQTVHIAEILAAVPAGARP
jgi:L-lactate dehydrogenase complex protein LldE